MGNSAWEGSWGSARDHKKQTAGLARKMASFLALVIDLANVAVPVRAMA